MATEGPAGLAAEKLGDWCAAAPSLHADPMPPRMTQESWRPRVWERSALDIEPSVDNQSVYGRQLGNNPLGRIVGVPSLWSQPGGVLKGHEMGVSRSSEAG